MGMVGTAAADKPSVAEAKKTAEDWLEGLGTAESEEPPDAAVVLSAVPLFAVGFNVGLHNCDAVTAKTAEAVRTAVLCLRKVISASQLEPWTKQAAKELPQPLRQYKAKLAALEKTATLVHHHEACAGQGSDVIIAVAFDKAKARQAGSPKVVAVFSQNLFCGE